ncbi:nucleotidyl transferase AbiEii/AbiGii toxin family protein, partial [Helicobacter sp. T3_23-1059]
MQEKDEKYTALYKTQDKILDIVAKEKLGFYLTGGTALQRFHFDLYRYSDDLDLFLIENGYNKTINKEFDTLATLLKDNAIDFTINPTTSTLPHFRQIIINENHLKID